jgi:ribosomal protein L11 methyltransferase
LEKVDTKPNVIVANILADVIMSFSADAASILPDEGLFIVSGIIGEKRDEVKNDLISKGFEIIESVLMEDWVAIIAKKKGV